MNNRFALPLLAAVLALPLAAAPAQQASVAQRDWTRNVAMTPEGGFRMGNPDARVKLVEYGSLTCSHCADFAKTGMSPLTSNYVKSGKVSLEYRNFVLNGIDAVAVLLARCAGPRGFFPLVESLFASQEQWMGKIGGMSQAQRDRIMALPQAEQLGEIAETGGLIALAARAGVTQQKAKQCLADKAGQDRLGQMNKAAADLGVKGTPTFFLNGAKVEAHDWSALEPLIRGAAG